MSRPRKSRAVAMTAALALAAGLTAVAGPAVAANPLPDHGTYTLHTVDSDVLGRSVSAAVYTPPQYDGKKPLPTTYVAPGGCFGPTAWTVFGGLQIAQLDEVFLSGAAEPQVVVFLDGSVGPGPFGNPAAFGNPLGDAFPDVVVGDVIPFVESSYNVLPSWAHRAIAGNSCGGVEAMNTVIQYPREFAELGMWSTGYFPDVIALLESDPALVEILSQPSFPHYLKYVEARIGADDDLAGPNLDATIATFARYGVDLDTYEEIPGEGHTAESANIALLQGLTAFHK
jgi:enterochelin esterase-like enzyme